MTLKKLVLVCVVVKKVSKKMVGKAGQDSIDVLSVGIDFNTKRGVVH